jgi:hypothetical protein
MIRRGRMSTFWGVILPTALGVTTAGIGVAVWAAGPYNNAGSDTLGEVAPDTISRSGANLTYQALGSGTGENNLVAHTQSVAFMSRNFKQATLTGHQSWQPGVFNVLGLDAAVLVTSRASSRVQNITLPNNQTTPPLSAGEFNYENFLSLILAGKDAEGTTAACMDQTRLDALQALADLSHVDQVDHFLRRNDASGTSDTIRERVMTNSSGGGRFCNGQAPGGVKVASTGELYTNSDAEDMDPIRRDCTGYDATNFKRTKCIYYPYNVRCDTPDGSVPVAAHSVSGVPENTPCTQGLVVAITDGDPDSLYVAPGTATHPFATLPVTVSIAKRVADDAGNKTFGYAGREAVKTTWISTAGPTISTSTGNKLSFTDNSVRQNIYPLSRRLFLNRGDNLTDSGVGGANYDKQQQENTLYTYATADTGDENSGRCNMAPIMTKWGFVSCHNNCNPSTWTTPNLCEDETIPAAKTTEALCVAGGKSIAAGATAVCCSDGISHAGAFTCPNPVGQVGP